MTGLFMLLFLAAAVGIFKPYIPGWKRGYFALAAFVALVLIGVFAPKQPDAGKQQAGKQASPTATDGASPAPEASPPAPPSKWEYSENKDEMRGTTTRYASLDSENEVDMEFPYGTVRGKLLVRKRPEDGLNVIFSVEKGQVLCNGISGNSYVSIKFDDKPVQKFSCTDSSDGSSEHAFIEAASRALAGLKGAKRTIIEAEFFQRGRQQFTFDTAGLDWK